MRILVTNNTLDYPGGSETYALALTRELVRRGHEVHAFGRRIGRIAGLIQQAGVTIHAKPPKTRFDLILASHTSTVPAVLNKGPLIQTCHGTLHKLERPVPGAPKYVAVSEEIADHLERADIKSDIIRNGVDCQRFSPRGEFRDTPRTALVLSRSSAYRNMVKETVRQMGMTTIVRDKLQNPSLSLEDDIQGCDIVFSLGRGAYEAMASGKVVFCLDNRQYMKGGAIGEGILTADNIQDALTCNCSGRFSKKSFSSRDILEDIEKHYSAKTAEFSRRFAVENLNVVRAVDEYLALLSDTEDGR